LDQYDGFLFFTQGDLTKSGLDKQPPVTEKGKQRLLDAVAAGKGFVGNHCASDTFHSAGHKAGQAFVNQTEIDPYIAMVGGEFIRHGRQQSARMKNVDPKFPGADKAGEGFDLNEEWYSLKNFAPDMHVILVQETKGMQDKDYDRPPYPATWARMHSKGRVFYTSMGHREDVWTNDIFQALMIGALRWTTLQAEADLTPNLKEVTPEATVLPKV
jgi:type 1 glutamine amidotransferase